jgi:hypothetical protein
MRIRAAFRYFWPKGAAAIASAEEVIPRSTARFSSEKSYKLSVT